MSVISQREIQIGAKTLIVYTFDYSGAIETFEVPASVQQVTSLHLDAGIPGLSSGVSVPSSVLTDNTAGAATDTLTRTVTVGTTAGPVGRVLVMALTAGMPGSFGISKDNSTGSTVYIISPK